VPQAILADTITHISAVAVQMQQRESRMCMRHVPAVQGNAILAFKPDIAKRKTGIMRCLRQLPGWKVKVFILETHHVGHSPANAERNHDKQSKKNFHAPSLARNMPIASLTTSAVIIRPDNLRAIKADRLCVTNTNRF